MSEESNSKLENENVIISNKMISHPVPYRTYETMKKQKMMPDKLTKINRIGGGTYGRIYQASTKQFPTTEKRLFPSLIPISQELNTPEKGNEDVVAVKQNFISPTLHETIGSLRELDILNLVKHHPFCIQLKNVSFGTPFVDSYLSPVGQNYISDRAFFVLEKGDYDADRYIRKQNNTQALVNERKLFAVQILLGVEFLSSRGIYHRDIKPANIICFMDSEDKLKTAKITDFGLSLYRCKQSMSSPGFVTIWYRAPEISLNKEYDLKVDVWSLGCVLFELFASGNRNFMRPMKDEELINAVIEKLPVSKEDYILAKQLYPKKITRSYDNYQNNIKSIKDQLKYTSSQIAQFNSSSLGGQPNFGSFDELADLLDHMLVVDPKKRYNISQCLNHDFFSGFKELIDNTRTSFGINNECEWVLQPIPVFSYIPNSIRGLGMKWFQIIYTNRNASPISNWYSHRILFHAIEMFDRYLILTDPSDTTSESDIVVWVDAFLFMASKYFRVMSHTYGLAHFAIGIMPEEYSIFEDRVKRFEEVVIKDIFKYKIYQVTIYEYAEDFLTEMSVAYFLKLLFSETIDPETPIKDIWVSHMEKLKDINMKTSPIHTPQTPTISINK